MHSYNTSADAVPAGDAQIADGINVVVVPASLLEQWYHELRQFVKPGWLDIFKISGEWKTRTGWWKDVFERSEQPQKARVVVLITATVTSYAVMNLCVS